MKLHRLHAFFLRHLYPLQRDFDLLSDMIYWPIIDTILWGVTSQWLMETSGVLNLMGSILTALVLWNVIWRAQAEVARNLMDEIWNNNLVNFFSTPLTLKEWIVGVLGLSVFKTTLTVALLVPLVWLFYSVHVFQVGWWFVAFFINASMTGWWIGFVAASIVLRFGKKVQTVIWTLPGILLPFSAVFFPVEKLPDALQIISMMLPTTYVFEVMRFLLGMPGQPVSSLWISLLLNIIYLSLAIWYFVRSFERSRILGLGRFD